MPRGSNPNPRVRKKIDWERVENYLKMGCTQREICACINISIESIADRVRLEKGMNWMEYAQKITEQGLVSLRAVQYEVAVKNKNTTMLIWLGKNRLGQSDKQEIESTGDKPAVNIYIPDNSRDSKNDD